MALFDPLNPTVLGFYLIQYISSFCLNQFCVSVTYNPKNSNKKKNLQLAIYLWRSVNL